MLQLDESIRISEKVLALMDDDIDRIVTESIFVSHSAVLLYSECEQACKQAVRERCNMVNDVSMKLFATSLVDSVTGKMKISDLKGTLGRFSPDYKEYFDDKISNESANLASNWDRMFNARANVAHLGVPAGLTLSELKEVIPLCRKVVVYYRSTLGLSTPGACIIASPE